MADFQRPPCLCPDFVFGFPIPYLLHIHSFFSLSLSLDTICFWAFSMGYEHVREGGHHFP
jgi:hypothetical protein